MLNHTNNPITAIRLEKGMSRREFYLALGKTYGQGTMLENTAMGSLPESWREGMEAMGLPFDELAAMYLDHRRSLSITGKVVAHG